MADQQLLDRTGVNNFLTSLENEQVFLVRGGDSFISSGAEAWLKPHLNPDKTICFTGLNKNPDILDLNEGIKKFRDFKPSLVLAVGGGSVLDMAKLIRFFGSIDTSPDEWLDGSKQSVSRDPEMPLIVVPTTSGSGAEATHFAVVYRNEVKYSVAHKSILADNVILRPELTMTMSAFQTAVSGLDAFFQGVESWWSRNATSESRDYSSKAIDLIIKHLKNSVFKPSKEAREAMQSAAYLAGRAINIAKTTSCHAFSYILTTRFGLPHGQAVAVTFPYILEYNLAGMNAVDADTLKNLLGLVDSTPRKWAEDFIGILNVKFKVDAEPAELYELWTKNVNIERLNNNPVDLDQSVFRKLSEYASR